MLKVIARANDWLASPEPKLPAEGRALALDLATRGLAAYAYGDKETAAACHDAFARVMDAVRAPPEDGIALQVLSAIHFRDGSVSLHCQSGRAYLFTRDEWRAFVAENGDRPACFRGLYSPSRNKIYPE